MPLRTTLIFVGFCPHPWSRSRRNLSPKTRSCFLTHPPRVTSREADDILAAFYAAHQHATGPHGRCAASPPRCSPVYTRRTGGSPAPSAHAHVPPPAWKPGAAKSARRGARYEAWQPLTKAPPPTTPGARLGRRPRSYANPPSSFLTTYPGSASARSFPTSGPQKLLTAPSRRDSAHQCPTALGGPRRITGPQVPQRRDSAARAPGKAAEPLARAPPGP